jgi:hypothetical protein
LCHGEHVAIGIIAIRETPLVGIVERGQPSQVIVGCRGRDTGHAFVGLRLLVGHGDGSWLIQRVILRGRELLRGQSAIEDPTVGLGVDRATQGIACAERVMPIGINNGRDLIVVGITGSAHRAYAIEGTRGIRTSEQDGAVQTRFLRRAIVGILYRDGASQGIREGGSASRCVPVDICRTGRIDPTGAIGDLEGTLCQTLLAWSL